MGGVSVVIAQVRAAAGLLLAPFEVSPYCAVHVPLPVRTDVARNHAPASAP